VGAVTVGRRQGRLNLIAKCVRAFVIALLLLLLYPSIIKNVSGHKITTGLGVVGENRHPAKDDQNSGISEVCDIDYSPVTSEEVRSVIELVFTGESRAWGLRVASCESSFDYLAANPNSSAFGVFQYLSKTWSGAWNPYRAYPRENAMKQILATKLAYDNGKQSWWSECGGLE